MKEMLPLIIFAAIICGVTLLAVKIVNRFRYKPYTSRKSALLIEIQELEEKRDVLGKRYESLNNETAALQELSGKEIQLQAAVEEKTSKLQQIEEKIASLHDREVDADKKIHAIQSKVDLYSRLDDFVEYGMYETPDYLYQTSERFALEIKKIRDAQRAMIQDKKVITITKGKGVDFENPVVSKVLAEQEKLMIRTFNIECDLLISKINPSNLQRTLERIDNIATNLEKSSADLRYGFNIGYVKLKYEECKLEYQFTLKKKEEQDEQRALREQIREEERARREYEAAIAEAAKEEATYEKLLQKARQDLEKSNDEERQAAVMRIQQLEAELSESRAKAARAISMAQQTKKGHVYIISNIGSFGENVYKIGLTRRLDPTERVKELGDASVPFSFDIHAIIASDNAPELENQLHKAYDKHRVNAVNLRKEFFNVSLDDIKNKVEDITGAESNFVMTILAEEYFQTKRMRQL